MYRCEVCRAISRPRAPQLRHTVKRLDGSILREIPVCGRCLSQLEAGTSLSDLIASHREERMPEEAAVTLPVTTPILYIPKRVL